MGHPPYTYDSLNRIVQANTVNTNSVNCWGDAFTIDAWGNLTNVNPPAGIAGGCATQSLSNPANVQNQLTSLTYDIAGNVINDGAGNAPTYDAESTMATDAGVTYDYDADGVRTEKSSGTMYWPGPSGTLTETDLTGTVNEEYIYFNGERIARIDQPSGTVHYYFSNHLGSASVITDPSGDIQEQMDYYPYGGISYSSGSDPNRYKFTGKERDSESGLDNFGARYNASSVGRFMSPDAGEDAGFDHMSDPQSWNGYAYVRNNPTTLTDPDGNNYSVCDTNGQNCADLTNDQYNQYLQSIQGTNTTVNSAGQIQYTNDNGSVTNLGTASYYNEQDVAAARMLVQTGVTLSDPRTIAGFYGASFLLGGSKRLGKVPSAGN